MRSSKHVVRRPYVPGDLRPSDLKSGIRPLGNSTQNMGLMKKSRKFFSDFIRSRLDSDFWNTPVEPRVSNNEGAKWRAPPLRGPAMRFSCFKGKKRKRESEDGCFYRQKNRLLKGGLIKSVTEEEMDRDDLRCRPLIDILYPEIKLLGIMPKYWPTFAIEELENAQDSFGDLTSELDNLTIIDDDDTIMRTPYTSSEVDNDSEISWMESISEWGDTPLARRRHSESSIEVPPCLDVVMDEFPTDSGRRSVPPQLDLAPSLTSKLTGFAADGHVPDAADDDFLKEFAQWLDYRTKMPPGSEYSVEMNDVAEDVNNDARVEAETEANRETEMETEAGIETQAVARAGAEVEVEVEVEVEAEPEAEPKFEPSVATELEGTGTVTTVDKASVRERSDEGIGETEMEEADASVSVSVSGEETGTNMEPERTETETETATEVEEEKENAGVKEANDIARVETPEAIPEDAMEGLETTPETTLKTTPETTRETVHTKMAAGKPEPRTPPPKPAAELTPEPTSPTPEPEVPARESALRLAFRTVHSLVKQVDNISYYDYGTDTCSRCQQIDMDVARRIRAVRERVMEELLVIEKGLRIVVECEVEDEGDTDKENEASP
ncbi:hypothetical protein J3F84DRAFT_407208 [Trichoderma pleuroticola]